MQNLEQNTIEETKFPKLYISKRELWKLARHEQSGVTSHYLSTIEFSTRNGFFSKYPHRIHPEHFKVSRNTLINIHHAYEETNSLVITRGAHNQILYSYPESYPRDMAQWLTLDGGYMIISRKDLLWMLENLSDTQLKTYLVLKMISEAQHQCKGAIKIFQTTLREKHLNVSQNTLKDALKSLVQMNLIQIEYVNAGANWSKSHILTTVNPVVHILRPSCSDFNSEKLQLFKICAPIKENLKIESINQAGGEVVECDTQAIQPNSAEQRQTGKGKNTPDFNFWGLGEQDKKVERPLELRTVLYLLKLTGLTLEQIQESVMRFSRYYFGSEKFKNSISNPVAYLITHLKKNRSVFLEPEWFLESYHREKDLNLDDDGQEVSMEEAYHYLADMVENYNANETQEQTHNGETKVEESFKPSMTDEEFFALTEKILQEATLKIEQEQKQAQAKRQEQGSARGLFSLGKIFGSFNDESGAPHN